MQKFEVERSRIVDGKLTAEKLTIELASPPRKLKKIVYALKGDYAEKLKAAKARLEKNPTGYDKADYDEVVGLTLELQRSYNDLLVGLCTNGAIKSADDLEDIGEEYVEAMHSYLEKKLGIVADTSKENFTKT